MATGRLLPDGTLILRDLQQTGTYTDPETKEKVEIELSTAIGGPNSGAPVVYVNGRFVGWEARELLDEAIAVFKENGIITCKKTPRATKKK